MLAMEVQVHESKDNSKYGMVGAIYDALPPLEAVQKPIGEWNRYTITCKGSKVQVIFNGKLVIDADLDNWPEKGKNPDGTPNKFQAALKDFARKGCHRLPSASKACTARRKLRSTIGTLRSRPSINLAWVVFLLCGLGFCRSQCRQLGSTAFPFKEGCHHNGEPHHNKAPMRQAQHHRPWEPLSHEEAAKWLRHATCSGTEVVLLMENVPRPRHRRLIPKEGGAIRVGATEVLVTPRKLNPR